MLDINLLFLSFHLSPFPGPARQKQRLQRPKFDQKVPKLAIFEMRPLAAKFLKQNWTRMWNGVTLVFESSNLVNSVICYDRFKFFWSTQQENRLSVLTFDWFDQIECCKCQSYSISHSDSLLFYNFSRQMAHSKSCHFWRFLIKFWPVKPLFLTFPKFKGAQMIAKK